MFKNVKKVEPMTSLCEVTEDTLVDAHQAGMAYYRRNPHASGDLGFVARSTGWRGELEQAWLAGFYGARRRSLE